MIAAGPRPAAGREHAVAAYDGARHLAGCAETLRTAFAHNHWPFWELAAPALATDYMRVIAGLCDLRLVVEEAVTGEARGSLLAVAPRTPRSWRHALGPAGRLAFKTLSGAYRLRGQAWGHLAGLALDYGRLIRKRPACRPHFEIAYFAVAPSLRGQGWGVKLMDACVEELGRRGADRAIVLTDSTMSWRFYESYGFRRAFEIRLVRAYAVALGTRAERGFVYELNVRQKLSALNEKRKTRKEKLWPARP